MLERVRGDSLTKNNEEPPNREIGRRAFKYSRGKSPSQHCHTHSANTFTGTSKRLRSEQMTLRTDACDDSNGNEATGTCGLDPDTSTSGSTAAASRQAFMRFPRFCLSLNQWGRRTLRGIRSEESISELSDMADICTKDCSCCTFRSK